MKLHTRMWRACLGVSLLALSLAVNAQQGASGNSIESINVAQQGDSITLKLGLREAPSAVPTGFSIANPARVALDFPNTSNGLGHSTETVAAGALRSVNVVQSGDRTRVVFNLNQPMTYETRVEGAAVFVTLSAVKASEAV
ncbi:MAG TPA: AMIN domain-containing protein, partial [Azospira sp.]|nr:AMIN domain-containing protein [Azospira sp.]